MGVSFSREMRFGLIGSLVGTVVMDIVLFLEYHLSGQPLTTSFMLFGSLVGGGAGEGVVLHLLFGSVLGLLFGISMSQFDALRINSVGKGLKVGVMAGLATIPLGWCPVCYCCWCAFDYNASFCHYPPSRVGFGHRWSIELFNDDSSRARLKR